MHRHHRAWRFGHMVFGPFSFSFSATGFGFPRRAEYLRMLKEYKQELEEELRAVEQEIAELQGETAATKD